MTPAFPKAIHASQPFGPVWSRREWKPEGPRREGTAPEFGHWNLRRPSSGLFQPHPKAAGPAEQGLHCGERVRRFPTSCTVGTSPTKRFGSCQMVGFLKNDSVWQTTTSRLERTEHQLRFGKSRPLQPLHLEGRTQTLITRKVSLTVTLNIPLTSRQTERLSNQLS